jgi:hypothetical protein
VAQVVGGELELETLLGERARRHHDARVVDQDIDLHPVLDKPLGELADGVQIGQVEQAQFHVRRGPGRLDLADRLLALGLAASGQDDMRAVLGQPAGRFEAEAAVGPGHDEGASGLVGNVGGGPACHEALLWCGMSGLIVHRLPSMALSVQEWHQAVRLRG